tara:strand:+ start:205 stop:387 length:183 start_codon:yes stop_codon:yes gene_type:complete
MTTNFNLALDDGDWVLLTDTLQDIISTGKVDDDLLEYLEDKDNPYTSLYNRIVNLSRIQG